MNYSNEVPFSTLCGLTLSAIDRSGDESITFIVDESLKFVMRHDQDCCETVSIEDVNGDLSDLVGSPILKAEESSNSDDPKKDEYDDSHTWTFYHIRTNKGTVTIRWYGTSNGYYSESVSLYKMTNGVD